jgi:hypothetical protein
MLPGPPRPVKPCPAHHGSFLPSPPPVRRRAAQCRSAPVMNHRSHTAHPTWGPRFARRPAPCFSLNLIRRNRSQPAHPQRATPESGFAASAGFAPHSARNSARIRVSRACFPAVTSLIQATITRSSRLSASTLSSVLMLSVLPLKPDTCRYPPYGFRRACFAAFAANSARIAGHCSMA